MRKRGAELAIIKSNAQRKTMRSMAECSAFNPSWYPFLVGGTERGRPEGDWIWLDGTPLNNLSPLWSGNERTGNWKGKDEECAAVGLLSRNDILFYDVGCSDFPAPYFCSKSPKPKAKEKPPQHRRSWILETDARPLLRTSLMALLP